MIVMGVVGARRYGAAVMVRHRHQRPNVSRLTDRSRERFQDLPVLVHHAYNIPTGVEIQPFLHLSVHHFLFGHASAKGIIPVLQDHNAVAAHLRQPIRPIPFIAPVGRAGIPIRQIPIVVVGKTFQAILRHVPHLLRRVAAYVRHRHHQRIGSRIQRHVGQTERPVIGVHQRADTFAFCRRMIPLVAVRPGLHLARHRRGVRAVAGNAQELVVRVVEPEFPISGNPVAGFIVLPSVGHAPRQPVGKGDLIGQLPGTVVAVKRHIRAFVGDGQNAPTRVPLVVVARHQCCAVADAQA